jgi:glycosyltransferase involved in cell wall biosynthesis
MEALSYGVPVVTTPAGAEGLVLAPGGGAAVVDPARFADALAGVLGDDDRRALLAAEGRKAMVEHHSPVAAATARVQALEDAFGVGRRVDRAGEPRSGAAEPDRPGSQPGEGGRW